jgi:hypothetical protein
MTAPRFYQAEDSPDVFVATGHDHSDEELDRALKNALRYFDTPYDEVPSSNVYTEKWIGYTESGNQCVCDPDGKLPSGEQLEDYLAVTVAVLKPEPEPELEDDLEVPEFEPEDNLWTEVSDARSRLDRELDAWSLEKAEWYQGANLSVFMSGPGLVATTYEYIRQGRISDEEGQDVLYDALLTTAATALAWVDAIKRSRASESG